VVLGSLALISSPASAGARPVVVELFTSQGCSSCPPADTFLTELASNHPDLLPLSFHVTYWDRLGWKDPYSLQAATDRQRDYASHLRDDTIYTPEMVVDGATSLVGSDRAQALQVIAAAPRKTVPVRITRDGPALRIDIPEGAGHAQVWLVGFDPSHQTSIGRGENSGRTLLESNIVRSLAPLATWSGSAIALRPTPPAGQDFAVLLQADDGRIIGAARLPD
jgi:hypothetical protein